MLARVKAIPNPPGVSLELENDGELWTHAAPTVNAAIEAAAKAARYLAGEGCVVELEGAYGTGCAFCGRQVDGPTAIVCGVRADTGTCLGWTYRIYGEGGNVHATPVKSKLEVASLRNPHTSRVCKNLDCAHPECWVP